MIPFLTQKSFHTRQVRNEFCENVNVYGKIECKQRTITKDIIQAFEDFFSPNEY